MERWKKLYDDLLNQHRDAGGPNATDYISDGANEILEAACRRIAELEQKLAKVRKDYHHLACLWDEEMGVEPCERGRWAEEDVE